MYRRDLTSAPRPGAPARLIWLALGSVALAEIASYPEPVRAVDNAGAICAGTGLHFVLIGTGDLALSPGRDDPAQVAALCAVVRDAGGP